MSKELRDELIEATIKDVDADVSEYVELMMAFAKVED